MKIMALIFRVSILLKFAKKNTTSSQNIEQFFFLNVLHMLALGSKLAISVG